MRKSSLSFAALAIAALTLTGPALADAGHGGAQIGHPGKAAQADRTIEITLGDTYYEPAEITVKAGETVRFVLVNRGELLHDFTIGTAAMHARHQEEMAMMVEHGMLTATEVKDMPAMDHSGMDMKGMDMSHDDPNSVLVEPGKTAELVWTFDTDATLEFACNVPGHYEAGMVGPITISK